MTTDELDDDRYDTYLALVDSFDTAANADERLQAFGAPNKLLTRARRRLAPPRRRSRRPGRRLRRRTARMALTSDHKDQVKSIVDTTPCGACGRQALSPQWCRFVFRMSSRDDGGTAWQRRGTLSGSPQAITTHGEDEIYIATDTAIYHSTDNGASFTVFQQLKQP